LGATGTNTVGDGIIVTNRNLSYPGLATSLAGLLFSAVWVDDRVLWGGHRCQSLHRVEWHPLLLLIFTIQDFGP